ncbi:hypothetical protein AVEN_19352-1 [Araneus ventricosus]|uniref:Uncharacterized protein n=1 Tax=Araneus ventricosus TaxID=182803 RepID=A0A4Y2HGX7_ARAVE|nr:hypothetical protein AVEN_19352-1 [Araneus ventricosus]
MVEPFTESDGDTCNAIEDMPADLKDLSFFVSDVVSYIVGFICRKLANSLKCAVCVSAMASNPTFSEIIEQKYRRGLVYSRLEIEKLCKEDDRKLRYFEYQNWLKRKNIIQNLIVHTLTDVESSLFHSLSDHILEQEVLHDHRTLLVKSILHEFFRIRLNHIAE